jgi:D-glycero-D-manno-heptose 1,7-bisphosphate phosphatase
MNIKLAILDRDGVINTESPAYIKTPEEWHAIPGSLEAIKRLNDAGIKVAVATNQSGVARGLYDLAMLERIHEKMTQSLREVGGHIDFIAFCPHHPDEKCDCRKPNPGMLIQIGKTLQIDLQQAVMIGDRDTDLQAAEAAGATFIFIGASGYPNLASAIDALLLS